MPTSMTTGLMFSAKMLYCELLYARVGVVWHHTRMACRHQCRSVNLPLYPPSSHKPSPSSHMQTWLSDNKQRFLLQYQSPPTHKQAAVINVYPHKRKAFSTPLMLMTNQTDIWSSFIGQGFRLRSHYSTRIHTIQGFIMWRERLYLPLVIGLLPWKVAS